ncbi:MAG: threonylcarbamoyl-AMP synthase [Clostridia bacterium]|nr:threonylcarbamoyl-AMP synthase [Clostridia bacterium]
MKTQILTENYFEIAKNIIENDEVFAFPTDTVYGLACSCFSEKAINKIYQIKGRDFNKALIVMIPKNYDLDNLVKNISQNAKKLMNKFWPGALTIIFTSKNIISKNATAGLDTIGIRIPNLQSTIDLINYINIPLCTTSANISGKDSPISAQEVLSYFNNQIPLIIDKGVCNEQIPSTIVDLSSSMVKILRVGSISEKEIFDTLSN